MNSEGKLSEKEEALQQKIEFLNEDLGAETVVELTEVYIESTHEIINKLKNALDVSDYEKIRNLVHSLRGNSGTFGFELLVSVCKELEVNISENKTEETERLLNLVTSEVLENVELLRKVLNQ